MFRYLRVNVLVVLDQFVASCREDSRNLFLLLQVQGSVHVSEGEKLRTLRNEKFDPPKEVPFTDTGATELAIKVCKVTKP